MIPVKTRNVGPGYLLRLPTCSPICWVLAYSGKAEPCRVEAVTAARCCLNIFLETRTSFGNPETIEFLVKRAGSDRVLFGSDMLLLDARIRIGRILTADISEEAKRIGLGLNTLKLLNL